MFQRIAKTHPLGLLLALDGRELDVEPGDASSRSTRVMADFRAAIAAAKKVKAPFTLATCGWVLGPPQSPALFDEFLPKDMPMGCINRQVGNTPVEPGFAKIAGPAEMGHSVDGRRSGHDHAATLGRPHAPRRRRRPAIRLHRPDGHPLAHPHPLAQRLRPGQGRVGPDRLEQGLEERRQAPSQAARGRRRRPAGPVPRQPLRRRRPQHDLPNRALRHEGLPHRRAQRHVQRDAETLRAGPCRKGQTGLRRQGPRQDALRAPRHLRRSGQGPRARQDGRRRASDRRPVDDRIHRRDRVPLHRRNRDRRQDGRHRTSCPPSPTRGRSIAAGRCSRITRPIWPPTGADGQTALSARRRFLCRLGSRGVRPEGGRAGRRALHPAGRPPAAPGRLGHRPRQHRSRRSSLGSGAKGVRLRR